MKLLATFLVAIFVVAAGTSFAFGDCAGHSKAQLVKDQTQEQMSKEQPANTGTSFTVAEKAAEPAKPVVKTPEKK
jgi:uncharacterized ferritin-like protein (DUF455 family)